MKLDFIALDKLSVSKANMRFGRKVPDVSDILPTVRKRGVLQPLIVRTNCGPDAYEIVAGARRFHAASLVAAERVAAGEAPDDMLPCAIIEAGDDAAAIEASLIENIARLAPDDVTRWVTFTRLVREGQSADDIAATFGMPDLAVRRILALGNLLPRIRDLYSVEKIDAATIRHLTMASKGQQRSWLALFDDKDAYVPTGHQLKAWLFGGQSVAVATALFDVEQSGLVTVADLFGEDRYFADSAAFWTAQMAAIEAKKADYLDDGWSDVVIIGPTQQFNYWEHKKAGKRKGARVYIDINGRGEVTAHEGYLTAKEAQRLDSGDTGTPPAKVVRPEISGPMATYVDLHRHAAVRATLCDSPHVALRLMVAHAIIGSPLWTIRTEAQSTRNDTISESIENSPAEAAFDERRRAVLGVLGFDPEAPTVTRGNADAYGLTALFLRLLDLPDPCVMDVIAVVMGETLASGSAAVEVAGTQIGTDMAHWWQADTAFFGLLRDREVLTCIMAEVAGAVVASANATEKTKTIKAVIADNLDGTNGREKHENWVPRWMAFPPSTYTARGGVGTVRAAALIASAREEAEYKAGAIAAEDEPDPAAPSPVAALPVPDDTDDAQPVEAEAEPSGEELVEDEDRLAA
mgnify:CR=1 FL=1